MLNLFPQASREEAPLVYSEAVSRLASVRHALALVEPFGAGPASDLPDDTDVAAAFENAGPARQHSFDRRSATMIGAAAAGLEALLIERQEGREPHQAASTALVDQIRRELRDVAGIVLS
jgi:hypothetical protein